MCVSHRAAATTAARLLRRPRTATRRRSTSCAPAPRRSASRGHRRRPRRRCRGRRRPGLRRAAAVPELPTAASSTARELVERAHAAGALVVVAADLLALTLARLPGRARRRHRRRQRPSASACPMGFGGPHAAFIATQRRARPAHARPHHRRLPRRPRRRRAAPGDPDPRAAHPPRQGDQQHLHGAGAARDHGRHVRGLSRPGRAAPHRAPRPRHDRARSPRACAASGTRCSTPLLRHAARPRRRGPRPRGARRRPDARHQPARLTPTAAVGVALDETTTRDDAARPLRRASTSRATARRRSSPDALLHESPVAIPASLVRKSPFLTHPVFHSYHSETRDAALHHQAPRRATCR